MFEYEIAQRREVQDLLRYFAYGHLPPHLQEVSRPFCELATKLAGDLPAGPQLVAALWRLLESKDCAVRAALDVPSTTGEPT